MTQWVRIKHHEIAHVLLSTLSYDGRVGERPSGVEKLSRPRYRTYVIDWFRIWKVRNKQEFLLKNIFAADSIRAQVMVYLLVDDLWLSLTMKPEKVRVKVWIREGFIIWLNNTVPWATVLWWWDLFLICFWSSPLFGIWQENVAKIPRVPGAHAM